VVVTHSPSPSKPGAATRRTAIRLFPFSTAERLTGYKVDIYVDAFDAAEEEITKARGFGVNF
jgi:hypothetical protein